MGGPRFCYVLASRVLILGLTCGLWFTSASAQCIPTYSHDTFRKVYRANKMVLEGLADLTGDGKPDAYGYELQSDATYKNIVVLPNNGTGGFGDPIIIPTTLPISPANGTYEKVKYGAVAIGNLNGDGKPDFVVRVASTPGAFFTLLSTKGSSYIQSAPTLATANEFVVSVADINGDGRGDIVTNGVPRFENTGGIGTLAYRLGNTDGTFGAAVSVTSQNDGISPVVGDFNNDGKPDISFVYNGDTNHLDFQALINLGGGLFSESLPPVFDIRMEISGAADLNGDGKLDLWGDGFLMGNGNGTFTKKEMPFILAQYPYPGLNYFGRNVLMDYDGDGDKDLVVAFEGFAVGVQGGPGNFVRKYYQVYMDNGSSELSRTDVIRPFLGEPADMNGDGKDDQVIFVNSMPSLPRMSGSNETALIVRENICSPDVHGQNKLIDFGGDGVSDLALWTGSNGRWKFVSNIYENNFAWGGTSFGDTPAPGDYDGDGKTDAAVFRGPTGDWWILRSSDGAVAWTHFGATGDIPIPADYNGDGKADIAVFRPSVGDWYIDYSDSPDYTFLHFGANGDIPIPADFDGDGKDNIAIYRPSSSDWFYLTSTFDNFTGLHWGATGDIPIPADFDMDGKADVAVFRPSDGNWYIFRSFDQGVDYFHFGQSGDIPMMVDTDGNGVLEIGVGRQPGLLWLVSSQPVATWASYGGPNDKLLRLRLSNQ